MTKLLLSPLFGVLLWLAALLPAQATILFAGGEDVDFTCVGTTSNCTVDTGGSPHYRTAYARLAVSARSGAVSDPPNPYLASPNFTATTHIWTHMQANSVNVDGLTNNAQAVTWVAADGNPAIILRGSATTGGIKITTRSTAGVLTDLVTCNAASMFRANTLEQHDIDINYAVGGSVTVYKNSVSVCTFTGDVTTNGRTQLQAVWLGPMNTNVGASNAFSEVIVADTDTRAKSLLRLTPNASGNTVAWTGANPCTVILPAVTFNDASYVQSGTNNQLEQCAVVNTFPAGTWRIDALVMSTRILRGATGPQHFQFSTRTGGLDFTSSDFNPTPSFSNIGNYIQSLNPNTSLVWTQAEITAAGFNIGLKSTP